MGLRREREAMMEGFNLAFGHLRGYVAARAAGARQHLTENLTAIKDSISDDLSAPTDAGALTESFLIALGDVVQVLCEQAAGADPKEQMRALERAINGVGTRINSAPDNRPRPPTPGWTSTSCAVCGQAVYEDEPHIVRGLQAGGADIVHSDCGAAVRECS